MIAQLIDKQKQYYNYQQFFKDMDLRKHQQTLMNIRSKYASLSKNNQSSKNIQKEKSLQAKDNQSFFHTPIKMLKKQQNSVSKKKLEPKQPSNAINGQSFMKKQPTNIQIVNNRFSFSNEKTFDEVIAERNKQLTERTERNKQILSKSKQIRQKQSRNNSIEPNLKDKQNSNKKGETNHLKLLFQDKNYIFNNEKHHQKPAALQANHSKGQSLYTTVKENVTNKMKQNLIQNLGISKRHQKKTKEQDKTIQVQNQSDKKFNNQRLNKYQASRQCSIRTPIPPPKQSSPNKIKSIFGNTKKIEERIHALLSR